MADLSPRIKELCDLLRKLRDDRGLEQKWVASKIGISADYLGRIERGIFPPSVDVLKGLAKIYRKDWKPWSALLIDPDEEPLITLDVLLTDDKLIQRFLGYEMDARIFTWAKESLSVLATALRDHNTVRASTPPADQA